MRFSHIPLFLREFRSCFDTTGAILPSGGPLAGKLASPMTDYLPPRRILEAGSGTGPVTSRLVSLLEPGDELVLSEINPSFSDLLAARLEGEWAAKRHQIRLVRGDVNELLEPRSYNLIVSGLPLNNFESDFVSRLLDRFLKALVPGGAHTFFEYIGIRPVRMYVGPNPEKKRLRGINTTIRAQLEGYDWKRTPILANVPPAWVYTVRSTTVAAVAPRSIDTPVAGELSSFST